MPMGRCSSGNMALLTRRTRLVFSRRREIARRPPSIRVGGRQTMTHRGIWLAAFGVVLGLASGSAQLHARMTGPRLSYLTFSGPVRLPGVILQAGTYAFEVADVNANIVIVRNKARNQLFYMGMTQRTERPRGANLRSAVSFGEVERGE